MQQITARALRQAEWKPVYDYKAVHPGGVSFTTYACDRLPGLTITKETRQFRRRSRVTTVYAFNKRKTDSPTQAVRYWNEHAKREKGSKERKPGEPNNAR